MENQDYFPDNLILNLSFKFALDIIEFAEMLKEKRKFVVGNQILKSWTSIGANVKEAQGAESKADFIHKLKIALKEADVTEYWLLLCLHSKNYPDNKALLIQVNSIKKVLSKIISSSKNNYPISTSTNQHINNVHHPHHHHHHGHHQFVRLE